MRNDFAESFTNRVLLLSPVSFSIIFSIMDGRILYLSLDSETVREEKAGGSFSVSSLYNHVSESCFVIVFPGGSGTLAIYKSRQNLKIARDFSTSRLAWLMNSSGIIAVVVTGTAHKLSYLSVNEDSASLEHCEQIRFSSPLYFAQVAGQSGDGFIAIGEAGERQSPLATCYCDTALSLGRGGLAAMMGSMNFKGIVIHTAKNIEQSVSLDARKSAVAKEMNLYGGASLASYGLKNGWLATKYFQGYYDPRSAYIDGRSECRNYTVEHLSCDCCSIACRLVDKASARSLPGWQDVMSLGSNLGVFSILRISALHSACMQAGLDCQDTGEILSYLNTQDCLPYTFPSLRSDDLDSCLKAVNAIASRKGNGELVSSGLSSLENAWSVNGRSLIYDLRGAHAQAFFTSLGENTPCYVDLVKNLRSVMSEENVGRAAAWLRIFTHALENRGVPAFFMLVRYFDARAFRFADSRRMLRHLMSGFASKDKALIKEGLESIDAFDSLFGSMDELPEVFFMPGTPGYTDELSMVKLANGYYSELEYIRAKIAR